MTNFKKEDILDALRIKKETELFYAAIGESMCADLINFVKRSPKEEFTRSETNFLVNDALSEVFFAGGKAARTKLCKVLQRAYWTDISEVAIGIKAPIDSLPGDLF